MIEYRKYTIETSDEYEMKNMLDASGMKGAIETYHNVFRKYLKHTTLPEQAYDIIEILSKEMHEHFEEYL